MMATPRTLNATRNPELLWLALWLAFGRRQRQVRTASVLPPGLSGLVAPRRAHCASPAMRVVEKALKGLLLQGHGISIYSVAVRYDPLEICR
eukprot:COSAG06_NODE_12048_length_1430_cov_1.114200_3_plen_92_part_00